MAQRRCSICHCVCTVDNNESVILGIMFIYCAGDGIPEGRRPITVINNCDMDNREISTSILFFIPQYSHGRHDRSSMVIPIAQLCRQ